jgi:hypothetical protein
MKWGIKQKLMIALGWFFVILGIIGAFLPVMPTTIFLIIALALFSKSSHRFHKMLLDNKYVGADLRRWQESKSMSRSSKVKAIWVIVLTFGVSIGVLHGRMGLQLMLVVIAVVLLLVIWKIKES